MGMVPCESVGFGWRRGSMASWFMSWDLASDGVWRQCLSSQRSRWGATGRMKEFALGIHMIAASGFTN
ncbi:hypothetical protein B5K08_06000 [Rhizobium leguminosarum bv. trifolii]|uniref:Uncharacterized protein n=1 Tax=Rhizobium leguminosarum bv. trifolii TaxID=386 RepID=A0A3E1BY98_RHILT|nr:hypothetical protein B5K08_06000 [Rhizobium leguminosarum bv. trifolii]RFC00046.1 hypothetical protein B5K10_05990 [Rhizobium leguminosarum bv. trifolii]